MECTRIRANHQTNSTTCQQWKVNAFVKTDKRVPQLVFSTAEQDKSKHARKCRIYKKG